jgi:hypothetical protein
MATVTDLRVDRPEICPRESARVEARTSPPDTLVSWSVDGQDFLHPDNIVLVGEFDISIAQGQTRTITASLDNSLSVTVTRKVTDIEIELDPEPVRTPLNEIYVITAEPRMPVITARAIGVGGPISGLQWKILLEVDPTLILEICAPHAPPDVVEEFDFSPTDGREQITLDFNNLIRGGTLVFIAKGIVNGCEAEDITSARIYGTNPQRSDIQAALPHDTLRRIACKESGQRQFDAPPDGGTGPCPLFGPGGRVGIMQIANPTHDEVWNWRLNVAKGIEIFNERVAAAGEYPSRVRNSEEFNRLVAQFNQRRQGQGLNPIQVVLPPFTEGDFDDNLRQLEIDAIHGYNGWNGRDRFGLELHEFRVAVDLIDGEEVLVVTNVNEETLQGEAVWESVPVADRPADIGSPNYVAEVLFLPLQCQFPGPLGGVVDIWGEDRILPCRILANGASRKYRAVATPPLGTFNWTCAGGASIVGSASAELVTVKGNTTSAQLDDVVLMVRYDLPQGGSVTAQIKLTVADVEKITVRVKASAALTPGRGSLADHQFDCTETAEAFPPDNSLILLRGDFEDVELQATVKPVGTPLAWDCKRASDDAASLGRGLPTLDQDAVDLTKAKLGANDVGSFFVRVFGDCGDKKFDPNVPFKLVPTVLVRATLQADASATNPENPGTLAAVVVDNFSVRTGKVPFDINNPGTAAIHMSATVNVVSGGADGRRLIAGVVAGWVNNIRADANIRGSYAGGHAISGVFALNAGTGPEGMFLPGDNAPNLLVLPLLDAGGLNSGTGGDTATLGRSRIKSRTNRPLGQRWIVEAIDSPFTSFPLLHPGFSTPAAPVRLQKFHYEVHFSANLCLWTNRSGTVGAVAERSYGVLRSYNWDILAEWNIDAANNTTVVTPMSVTISGGVTRHPPDRPTNARCEVTGPSATPVFRRDGRT